MKIDVHIRWMIRRDMPEVLAIEQASFEDGWAEEDFLRALRQRNCIGMVAEKGERVVGYMLYELHKEYLLLLNLAVDPNFRGSTIGRQMAERLVKKMSPQRRARICLTVRETNLGAQLFFRAVGFRATGVARRHFDDTGEDGFEMVRRLSQADQEAWEASVPLAGE